MTSVFFGLALSEEIIYLYNDINKSNNSYIDPESDYAKKKYRHKTWEPNPGSHSSRKISSTGDTIYNVIYSIGKDRFRTHPQPDREYLSFISFFGCSWVFGEGLNDNETLPFYVNTHSVGIKTKNLGYHGFGVNQALEILVSDTNKLKSNINFLLTAPWHEIRSACKTSYSTDAPKYIINENDSLVRSGSCPHPYGDFGIISKIASRSNLINLIREIVLSKNTSRDDDFRLYLKIISRMYQISTDNNQIFVIGFVKADEIYFKGSTYSNKRIFQELQKRSDEVIDLTLANKSENLNSQYFIHPEDKHPSALANYKRAKIIIPFFKKHL